MYSTKLIAVGLVAGFASGLLGVGGGVIIVPLLLALGFSQHRAHATSLGAIMPLALVGAVTFASHGRVSYSAALYLAAGALLGAPLGARVMAATGQRMLRAVFGAAVIVLGISLMLR